ncbi:MAG: class I tRNA ligase family protein [Verrucomicrobia bacterium]|nr:class I tRNA ligase family protein [Verrucomicrobiota bacterium]MDA1006605.1 class I tRNA ligase family protein [Verrucomicrobiota bacterium]
MSKDYFITTAIDYPNGLPHIGHAYEKILADVIARYRRLNGQRVYFLTGVDQHGQKMQQTAEAEGVNVATLAKRNTKKFLSLWDTLGVHYDGWAETTADDHKHCVQAILRDLHDKGQLYKKTTTLSYSVRQEQYLTDKDRTSEGNFGPEWGEVVKLEEENWWFKLSEHAAWLKGAVESDTFKILPAFRKSEVTNAIERAADTDLCISRPKARLHWGIEIPFDTDFVTYVWFDALINYISFAGYRKAGGSTLPDFDQLWPADAHVIGKDILVPAHSIYWPCMLHAMGFADDQMPTLLVHGWWNSKSQSGEEEKMSKSLGNVVDPAELAQKFGVDALRYYLVRDITTGKDSAFDLSRLIMLFNTELANDLGNLLNRSLTLTKRGALRVTDYDDGQTQALRESLAESVAAYQTAMEHDEVSVALGAINSHVVHCNGFLERNKPWNLAKDESQADRLAAALYHICESCTHLAILLGPVLPTAAEKILAQLRFTPESPVLLADLQWGLLQDGHETGKPKPVFPRIEIPQD